MIRADLKDDNVKLDGMKRDQNLLFKSLWTAFIIVLWSCITPAPAPAHAQILYEDDFETGATGWSNNANESHPNFSRYLGRFDNSPNQTTRTFAVPAGTETLQIAFDFYRFDSWDNTSRWGFDRFQIDINGSQLFSFPMTPGPPTPVGSSGNVSWEFTPFGPTNNQAYGRWADYRFRVVIEIDNPPASVAFTLRTAINQGGNDESGGFDNFRVEAIPFPPNVSVSKISALDTGSTFRAPDEDLIYTIDIHSTGGTLDANSVNIADFLPPEIEMFTGNFDGSGNPVSFTDLSAAPSGITCCTPANLGYADEATGPLVFDYNPNGSYDPAVTGLEIVPSGQVREGISSPVHLRFQFRARIR